MSHNTIFEAESVEEAVQAAAEELGLEVEAMKYEVLEKGSKKIFGLGSTKLAKIQIIADGETELVEGSESDEESSVDGNPLETELDTEAGDLADELGAETPLLADKDIESLEDSDIDTIADEAIAVITKIAGLAGASQFTIEEFEGEEGEIILDIVGDDLSFLIGRHGRTLEAIQTLSSAIVTKRVGMRYPIAVDVEGYRHRRKQKVIEIAQRAASRAKAQGRPVSLKPMTAQERRLCHIAIRDIPGVNSSSEGSGNYRHVVVYVEKNEY